jgi:hypothetical protein
LDLKEILYASIENHKKYIVSDIAQGKSHDVIDSICKECIPILETSDENKSEILGSFAEGLVHYLLTEALIPSQRKITIGNTYVDIVIPDTRILKSNPQDVLLIIFPKTNNIEVIRNRIAELEKIQLHKENIWVVLENHVVPEVRTYSIYDNEENPFSRILNDIISFLTNKKQSKLKLFRI